MSRGGTISKYTKTQAPPRQLRKDSHLVINQAASERQCGSLQGPLWICVNPVPRSMKIHITLGSLTDSFKTTSVLRMGSVMSPVVTQGGGGGASEQYDRPTGFPHAAHCTLPEDRCCNPSNTLQGAGAGS